MNKISRLALFLLTLAAFAHAQTTVLKEASKKPAPAEPVQKPDTTTKPSTATSGHAPAKVQKVEDMMDSFQIMEKAFWQAWKDRDAKPFDQHMAPNALMIDNTGIADRATTLKGITSCEVKGYNLSDFKLTKVNADAALLTYKAENVDAVCDGQKAPTTIYASTLYSKSGGTWWMNMHQESAAMRNEPAK